MLHKSTYALIIAADSRATITAVCLCCRHRHCHLSKWNISVFYWLTELIKLEKINAFPINQQSRENNPKNELMVAKGRRKRIFSYRTQRHGRSSQRRRTGEQHQEVHDITVCFRCQEDTSSLQSSKNLINRILWWTPNVKKTNELLFCCVS